MRRVPPLCSPILCGRFCRVAWFALGLPASWASSVRRRQLRGEEGGGSGSVSLTSPAPNTPIYFCASPLCSTWAPLLCSTWVPLLCSPILHVRFRRVAWCALGLPAGWATLVPRRQLRREEGAKSESPSTQTRHIVGPKSNFPSTNFSLIISGRS